MNKKKFINHHQQLMILCHSLYTFYYYNITDKQFDISRYETFLENFVYDNTSLENCLIQLSNIIRMLTSKQFGIIEKDYARLFVGPGDLLAPPWGSVYMDPYKETFSAFTMDVNSYYEFFGLKLNTGMNEPADHIGLMFSFISFLLFQIQKLESEDKNASLYIEAMSEFLTKYMSWASKFLKLVRENASTSYYKQIAILTESVILYLSTYNTIVRNIYQ